MNLNLETITSDVCDLAKEVGKFLLAEVSTIKSADVEIKGLHNFVTRVDKESERRLVEGLSEILPGSGFIAEENSALEPGAYTWIIDPLDGTTNFIHQVPVYTISIALTHLDETLSGVIYEPNSGECFYTWAGAPSYLNGKVIRVTEISQLSDALFATGFPYYDYSKLDDYLAIFRYLLKNSHGVRRLGSAAADLAWVACGRLEGFYEYGLSPWDVAAGGLLVKNAGGIVTDFNGGGNYLFGKEVIATNSNIFGRFLKLFEDWDHNLK